MTNKIQKVIMTLVELCAIGIICEFVYHAWADKSIGCLILAFVFLLVTVLLDGCRRETQWGDE